MIMPTLTGKTALVTGASRGMGRASALALAAAGAQVLVHYGRGAKEADGVVAEIRKAGGRADAIATDLATADGAGKLAKQARSIIGDRLDILVANAGVSKAATIEEMTVGWLVGIEEDETDMTSTGRHRGGRDRHDEHRDHRARRRHRPGDHEPRGGAGRVARAELGIG